MTVKTRGVNPPPPLNGLPSFTPPPPPSKFKPTSLNQTRGVSSRRSSLHSKKEGFMSSKKKKVHSEDLESHQHFLLEKQKSKLFLTQSKGYLEAEGLEKTYKFTQESIKEHLDLVNQAKIFDLNLSTFGPYFIDYTPNGRHLLLGGQKGHIATMDWKKGQLKCEFYVKETVRDVCWLHNETLLAIAQKEFVYLYDQTGVEIHVLRKHHRVQQLQFLPYHFLLATIGDSGILRYQDVSMGQLMYEQSTHRGTTRVMTMNPSTGIVYCGHSNGTVTLWSPNTQKPLIEVLCHRTGPVTSCAVHDFYLFTAGTHQAGGGCVSLWDVRNMYQHIHTTRFAKPIHHLSVSQQGLWACTQGTSVHVHRSFQSPPPPTPTPAAPSTSLYMQHTSTYGKNDVFSDLQFVPFEDVLGVGRHFGFSSLIVPGSGEPNFDSLEAHPYETKKQRREREIHRLLEKIPAETLVLNPDVLGQKIHSGTSSSLLSPFPMQPPLTNPSSSSSSSMSQEKETSPNNAEFGPEKEKMKKTPSSTFKKIKRREQLRQRRLRRLLGPIKAKQIEEDEAISTAKRRIVMSTSKSMEQPLLDTSSLSSSSPHQIVCSKLRKMKSSMDMKRKKSVLDRFRHNHEK
ncbi:hypothetical protein HMI54_004792 [Coelomomyces lativittatus]|nr:hypothetical protein HMI56_002419 [Coelomomyces lativittatus]KAJ1506797.1 hypothetical protein HMI54_004792 [Coelomomyces lativittatus]KAJ1506990.1 hypothetical protein HMI55_000950 [Coelomomyces lativittatus]